VKKLFLILAVFLVLAGTAGRTLAMGSPQSTNPNGPNYVPPSNSSPATPAPAPPTGKGFTKDFGLIYQVQNSLAKAGPQIAVNLANISGQLFSYLAIIALVMFSVKELMFGDKGIKEFMIFFLLLMFARGLLAAYNLFFVDGIVNFFNAIGQQITGSSSPMSTFGNLFQIFYLNIGKMSVQGGGLYAMLFEPLVVTIAQIFLLIIAITVLGTIILIQIYITLGLLVGYIFVPFMIFKPLEFLWNGWLKFMIASAFSYFLIYLVTALLQNTINSLVAYNRASMSFGEVMGFLLLLAIFAYLFLKIPSIAGEIVSGMPNMSFSGMVGVAVGAASIMFAGGRLAGTAVNTAQKVIDNAKGNKGDKK
jgi:hypothetical protein